MEPDVAGPIGLDTNVLVHWLYDGAAHHHAVRAWVSSIASANRRFALTQQVLAEFLHVITDRRRFEPPMSMEEALQVSLELWHSEDVMRITMSEEVHARVCDLMTRLRLGRKRILDTQLAVTLEKAGVGQLATLNGRDFEIFSFLEVLDPRN